MTKLATAGTCVCLAWIAFTLPLQAGPGSGTLFGTDPTNLITLNLTTGAGTVVGPMGIVAPSLAVDPTTGIMYAGRGGGTPNLYRVNPANGALTLVGGTGLGVAAIPALDFTASGVLYASVNLAGNGGTGGDHLAVINKSTGAATVIGPFGSCTGVVVPSNGGGSCTIEGMEAIAFSPTGVLYGALRGRTNAGTPGLYTINTSTGAATLVAPIVDGSSNPPLGGIVSLQFHCNGTLYGGTARPEQAALLSADEGDWIQQPAGARLVTINPATGVFSYVGSSFATSGGSLAGLAFGSGCGCPPHTVHGHISTVPPTHSGTSHEHHGTHGHTVAVNCPSHVPGHSAGLTPDEAETLFPELSVVAAWNQDGTLNGDPAEPRWETPTRAAGRGDILRFFGSTTDLAFIRDASGLAVTRTLPEVRIGGVPAPVLFSGLVPGLMGVWEIHVRAPEGAPAGNVHAAVIYEGREVDSLDVVIEE